MNEHLTGFSQSEKPLNISPFRFKDGSFAEPNRRLTTPEGITGNALKIFGSAVMIYGAIEVIEGVVKRDAKDVAIGLAVFWIGRQMHKKGDAILQRGNQKLSLKEAA